MLNVSLSVKKPTFHLKQHAAPLQHLILNWWMIDQNLWDLASTTFTLNVFASLCTNGTMFLYGNSVLSNNTACSIVYTQLFNYSISISKTKANIQLNMCL